MLGVCVCVHSVCVCVCVEPDVGVQDSLLLEAVEDEVVGLFVFIEQKQLTEVNCIHLECHSDMVQCVCVCVCVCLRGKQNVSAIACAHTNT